MDAIQQEFSDAIIRSGNLELYNEENAIKVVERCRALNLFIYGIDSFYLTEEYIQPSMEHSIDYLAGVDSDVWGKSIEFIKSKLGMGFVFEIYYDGY